MNDALVFSAKDGLGNRLRALAGFRALAEFLQVPMLLHWGRDGACDAEFTDLFETAGWEDVRLIDAEEAAARRESHPERYHHSSVWFSEIWRQHGQGLCSGEDFARVAVRHLRALRPRRALQARVDEFARAQDLGPCTGMHIRMTDNVHAYDWWIKNDPDFVPEKVSRMEGFRTAIRNRAAAEERVFICTDNQEIARQLRTEFPNLVMYQKDFDDLGFVRHVRTHYGTPGRFSRLSERLRSTLGLRAPTTWRTTDVSDALVEMLLLARCQRIIGTYYSSFSQVAALIGGVPLYRMEGTAAVENAFVQSILEAISENSASPVQTPS